MSKQDNVIKVSIIIPIYNCERYLEKCLESILHQTCEEIEIICINDCSVDCSLQILETLAKQDDRIKIINNQTNKGAGFCRNIGIKNARGMYVAFVDADDYCELTMLEDEYKCCEYYKLDLLLCDYFNWDEVTQKEYLVQTNWLLKRRLKEVFSWKDVKEHIFDGWLWVPWNRMYRKDFLVNNELYYSEIENSEDVYFNSLAMVLAKRIHLLDKPYYYYRNNVSNQLSRNLDVNCLCTIHELKKLQSKLINKGIFNEVKKSYYNLAAITLQHSLVNLQEKKQKELYEYYQKIGFEEIKLPLDTPSVFYERSRYNNLIAVRDHSYSGRNTFLQQYTDVEYYQLYKEEIKSFFDEVSQRGKVAVWGAGRRGIALEKILDNAAQKIGYYLDKDYEKQGQKIGAICIYSDKEKICEAEQIIVLNHAYWEEILEQIEQEKNVRLKVYDLESYLMMGCNSVDMCMVEI